jgi:PKD repeat protein
MKKRILILLLTIFPLVSFAQYPPLELVIGTVTSGATGTVDVPVMAGSNFQNIVQLQGTFTFNPAVVSWNSMQSWGLTNIAGASFVNGTSGTISFNWASLISVGPTLSAGSVLFNLRFNVVGAVGTSSPVGFVGSPQAMNWGNGFGWGGSNFAITNGLINIGCNGPNPSFNAVASNYVVDFIDGSTGATSWSWTLGDGTTATTQNVNHTYSAPGTYAVCLTSTNSCGSATTCQNVDVCTDIPVVGYTYIQNGLTVVFTDTTQGAPTSRLWDFGDGTTGTATNTFIHTFPAPGTYTVCLTATNGCGTDSACHTIIVVCPLPVASFTNTGSNFNYSFTSTSTSTLTWSWDFGDGATSTLQNPTHTYTSNGTYNVCLIATSNCGSDTTCESIVVSCPTPGSAWTVQTNNLTATFADATPNMPTSWAWDFGDGTTSTMQNPSHTYATSGAYTVCLITANSCGPDTSCNQVAITVVGLEEKEGLNFEVYPNPAHNFVQINSSFLGKFNVTILDLQGKTIRSVEVMNNEIIETAEIAKGTYLMAVSNENGTSTKRLVIE